MKKIHAGLPYVISLIYVFLGVVIYDWTTHMAPALDGRGQARTIFLETFLICLGLIIFVTTFIERRKNISQLFWSFLFFSGLTILVVVGFIVSLADRSANSTLLKNYWEYLWVSVILYLPAVLLYLLKIKRPVNS